MQVKRRGSGAAVATRCCAQYHGDCPESSSNQDTDASTTVSYLCEAIGKQHGSKHSASFHPFAATSSALWRHDY